MNDIHGIILLDKPEGKTSFKMVQEVKKILRVKKAGHFGTLDPFSSGLLIIGLGKSTRLFNYFLKERKLYQARIRLGYATDSYDREGRPLGEEKKVNIERKEVEKVLKEFEGEVWQIPPPFSSKKVSGKPSYLLARRGKIIKHPPKPVHIYFIELLKYESPFIEVKVQCSSGTYLRTLAYDIGERLKVGGHLWELRRLKIGEFDVSKAITIERLKEDFEKGDALKDIIPIESVLDHYPKIIVKYEIVKKVLNGNPIKPTEILKRYSGVGDSIRIFSPDGRFIAIAKDINKRYFRPVLVFSD
ncbi:MAG: tRNA pseudouridine(55) synthase TruB [Candidatus Aminicenantia bacterium]